MTWRKKSLVQLCCRSHLLHLQQRYRSRVALLHWFRRKVSHLIFGMALPRQGQLQCQCTAKVGFLNLFFEIPRRPNSTGATSVSGFSYLPQPQPQQWVMHQNSNANKSKHKNQNNNITDDHPQQPPNKKNRTNNDNNNDNNNNNKRSYHPYTLLNTKSGTQKVDLSCTVPSVTKPLVAKRIVHHEGVSDLASELLAGCLWDRAWYFHVDELGVLNVIECLDRWNWSYCKRHKVQLECAIYKRWNTS